MTIDSAPHSERRAAPWFLPAPFWARPESLPQRWPPGRWQIYHGDMPLELENHNYHGAITVTISLFT